MLKKPARPTLAPADATDNDIAEERTRFGQAYIKLECKFDGLVAYILEKPAPTCGPAGAEP